ncbi:MAG: hypothetical protein HYR56_14630 [Acidobacteria bacterium]|nr:hypothetical protein [Acidobacteriota bacterium]MBI3425777.1 hypothetical protein [Acidobacteriota bacterium]
MSSNQPISDSRKSLASKIFQPLVWTTIGALTALVAVRFLYPNAENVKINFFGKQLEVAVKNKQVTHEELLNEIFAKDFARAGAVDWVKKNQGLYPFTDTALVEKFSEMLPDRPPASQQETLQQRTERLQKAIEKVPSVRELRRKSKDREAPFQPVGEIIQVKYQKSGTKGRAFVPYGSYLVGRVIELYDQAEEKLLTLRCEEGISGADGTKVLLNPNQFKYLFGSIAPGMVNAIVIEVSNSKQLSNL